MSEVKDDEITGQYEQVHPERAYHARPALEAGDGQEGRGGGRGRSVSAREEIFALDVEETKIHGVTAGIYDLAKQNKWSDLNHAV